MILSSIVNSTALIKSVLLTIYLQINIYYQLLESEKQNMTMIRCRTFTIPQLHPSTLVHQEIQHIGYLLTG